MLNQNTARGPLAGLMLLLLAACGGETLSGTDDPVDDGGSGGVTPASLSLTAASTELPSSADDVSEGLTLTAVALDADRNALANAVVSFAATSGELSVANSGVTDADGRVTAVLTTASSNALRTITVLASSGGAEDTIDVTVVTPQVSTDPVYRMGVLSGDTFESGQILIGSTPLSSGGSSGLTLQIVDTANDFALYTGAADVTFSSSCIAAGTATVSPNPATSANGSVSATYVAQGCSGTDVITAVATIDGTIVSATGSIEVLPSALGSIEFVSATPTTIGLKGSGQVETSTVIFRVKNESGGPVADQSVSFSLNTTVGGIQLDPAVGTTNAEGYVQTVVRSGTVHTAVRVTAEASQVFGGETIIVRSQSEQLLITTGLPDQDSFSISASVLNVEAWNTDGSTSEINIYAADRFNNPVPDGTAIAFTTEGGSIEGGCTTNDGFCSVTWTSQDPRAAAFNNCANGSDSQCAVDGSIGASRAGRATVLATALGEESFTDLDGDGTYDDNEPFTDLAEAFRDDDGDGSYDLSFEEFADFNVNGVRDGADGDFNGLLCDGPSKCAPAGNQTLNVRASLTIVMSASAPTIDPIADISYSGGTYNGSGGFTVSQNQSIVVNVVVRDLNDQPMPAGTEIRFGVDGDGELLGTTTFVVPNTINDQAIANTYGFVFSADEIEAGQPNGSALVEMAVESPSGLTPIYSFFFTILAPSP